MEKGTKTTLSNVTLGEIIMSNRTIARLFDEYADAAHAVRELEYFGIPSGDIGLVANNAEQRIIRESGENEAVPGAEIGAGVGAVAGGGVGVLTGLGLLAVPGSVLSWPPVGSRPWRSVRSAARRRAASWAAWSARASAPIPRMSS